jgi:VWFA-related protein
MNRRTAVTMLMAPGAGLLAGLTAARITGIQVHARDKKHADETFTLRSDVRLVLLDVSVKDRNGGFAGDLTKANFAVEENGRPQRITVFSHEDTPVTIGILVDESRSMTPKHADVLKAANVFIEECNRRDEIFVLHFNDVVKAGLPANTLFSDDVKQLHDALMRGRPAGKTALYDAVIAGLEQLGKGRQTRKALVLISDGGDTASAHTRREMMDMVEHSPATIYAVGIYDEEDPDRAPGLLNKLAGASGGLAFFPAATQTIVPACRQIAREIRSTYTVGYVPDAGNGDVRHIQVRVAAPGRDKFIVRSRNSYRYSGGEA